MLFHYVEAGQEQELPTTAAAIKLNSTQLGSSAPATAIHTTAVDSCTATATATATATNFSARLQTLLKRAANLYNQPNRKESSQSTKSSQTYQYKYPISVSQKAQIVAQFPKISKKRLHAHIAELSAFPSRYYNNNKRKGRIEQPAEQAAALDEVDWLIGKIHSIVDGSRIDDERMVSITRVRHEKWGQDSVVVSIRGQGSAPSEASWSKEQEDTQGQQKDTRGAGQIKGEVDNGGQKRDNGNDDDDDGHDGHKTKDTNNQNQNQNLALGKEIEGEKVVILSSHIDTTNLLFPRWLSSPGADDNASGVAVLLEVLHLVSQIGMESNNGDSSGNGGRIFQPQNTIQFHFYSAEEGGMLGSKELLSAYKDQNVQVVALLQLDQIGFSESSLRRGLFGLGAKPDTKAAPIGLVTDYTTPSLRNFLKLLISELCNAGVVESECGYACSDSASGFELGYPVALAIEGEFNYINRMVHSQLDTIDRIDFDYLQEFVSLAVGYVVELGYFEGFD